MKYQKMINLLDNASTQPFKFRTKIWLKQMMNQEEYIIPIATLNLKLQC